MVANHQNSQLWSSSPASINLRTSVGLYFLNFRDGRYMIYWLFHIRFQCQLLLTVILIDFPPWWTLATDIRKKIMSEFNWLLNWSLRKKMDKPITSQPSLLLLQNMSIFSHPGINIILPSLTFGLDSFCPVQIATFLLFISRPPVKEGGDELLQ